MRGSLLVRRRVRPRVPCAPASAPRCRLGYFDVVTRTSHPCAGPAVDRGLCCWHLRQRLVCPECNTDGGLHARGCPQVE